MFTGDEEQQITLAEGSGLTANYRAAMASGQCSDDGTLGHYFSKKTLLTILAQDACVGVRMYYGQSTSGAKELVITGVDKDENDIVAGYVGDKSYKSPPHSGSANALNS